MSVEHLFPNAGQLNETESLLNQMRWSLAAIAKDANGVKIDSYADIQSLVRLGLAGNVIEVGDQIMANKASAITAAVAAGSNITAASVNFVQFLNAMGTCPAGSYHFYYYNRSWHYNDNAIRLGDYGISVTGSAHSGDEVIVTVTGTVLKFDVVANDYDKPADNTHTHALSLLSHDVVTYGTIPFDAREAFYYCEAALPAGTYHFTVTHQPWYSGDVNKTYQFTLASQAAAGSQLVLTNSYNATMENTNINIFASSTATTAAQTAKLTLGNEGTDLGNLTNAGTETTNSIQKSLPGYNGYIQSAMRQYINSDAAPAASGAVASWWTPQNNYDRPVVTTIAGFLYGVDPDFVRIIGEVRKRTAKNTVSDGGGYVDSVEKVFLASRLEIYGSQENGVNEGAVDADDNVTTKAYPFYDGTGNADKIKYQGSSARYWWLRSPSSGNANGARYVLTDGSLAGNLANHTIGAVPGLCIV